MAKSFEIVRSVCIPDAGMESAGDRYLALLSADPKRAECGCYGGVVANFCRRDFERVTGISLQRDERKKFVLVPEDGLPDLRLIRQVAPAHDVTVDVEICPRCGGPHGITNFKPLTHAEPSHVLTHWAQCPATGEPIIVGWTSNLDTRYPCKIV